MSSKSTKATPPLPECLGHLDVTSSNADIIVQSSNLINFPVRKSVLASSSQVFRDMFLLPQTSANEIVDGLPVVCLSEDMEIVWALITMLYPIPPEIPSSYERVLVLLAAAQKYDMTTVQSSIHVEIIHRELPTAPTGARAFRAFAIAFSNNLTPEVETTARLTLDYPLTFETLGCKLWLFRGFALCELVGFQRECKDNIISCLELFLDA
jgi:BTB/POZ domain-containing protein